MFVSLIKKLSSRKDYLYFTDNNPAHKEELTMKLNVHIQRKIKSIKANKKQTHWYHIFHSRPADSFPVYPASTSLCKLNTLNMYKSNIQSGI